MFFEEYRQAVHLIREDKVPIKTKFLIFYSLMKPDSPAQLMMRPFVNNINKKQAYDESIRLFWREFGSDQQKLIASAKNALGSCKPLSRSNKDQLAFVYDCMDHYQSMVQCGMKETAAARKVCEHIVKNLDSTLLGRYLQCAGINYKDVHTFFNDNPKKSMQEMPDGLRYVFQVHKEEESEDITFGAK